MNTAPTAVESAAPGRPFTGRHMLALTLAFFGVIIGVNVTMAVFAFRSWTGLATANAYVEAQAFETRRLAHEAQKAAGWNATFTHGGGIAVLALSDGEGAVPDLGEVTLKVNRPVGGQDDQLLLLTQRADGAYVAGIELAAGVWDATITAPETLLGPFVLHTRLRIEAEE